MSFTATTRGFAVTTKYYVYVHEDDRGKIFYVGKGTGRRAWKKNRHPIWAKYVAERLAGSYRVRIMRDGLTDDESTNFEGELIERYGSELVNWINPGRQFDYEALRKYHAARDANRKFVADTKLLEANQLEEAIKRYYLALSTLREYEALVLERGLVAELSGGRNFGDPAILDRLTLCLIRGKRVAEAAKVTAEYFRDFPSAADMKVGKRIIWRISKIAPQIDVTTNILRL